MTYKMERFKVTLSDDSNLMKQYGGTSQVETSLVRGLDAEFNDSLALNDLCSPHLRPEKATRKLYCVWYRPSEIDRTVGCALSLLITVTSRAETRVHADVITGGMSHLKPWNS
ncbi:hypothetical protein J6590_051077 [Homalodisca vitripennis]|nr:hypothetical protein J6590_051077 [Homalodisca vitripennis]